MTQAAPRENEVPARAARTSRRSHRIAIWITLPLVLAAVAGCGKGSGPNELSSSSTTSATGPASAAVTTADAATESATTAGATTAAAPTAAQTAGFGPRFKSDELNLVAAGGYRAVLTVAWHRRQAVAEQSLFPGCLPSMYSGSSSDGTGQVLYYAVTAQLSARFPTTSGFAWPSDQPISVRFSDGKEDQTGDRAYTCFDSQDLNSSAFGVLDLTPESPTATVMFVETATRSPDNPSGSLNTDPGTYVISPDDNCDSSAHCMSYYGS